MVASSRSEPRKSWLFPNWHEHCLYTRKGNSAFGPKHMSTIDQSRLLQMRSTILSQNGALQRAAGRDDAGGEGVRRSAQNCTQQGQGGAAGVKSTLPEQPEAPR